MGTPVEKLSLFLVTSRYNPLGDTPPLPLPHPWHPLWLTNAKWGEVGCEFHPTCICIWIGRILLSELGRTKPSQPLKSERLETHDHEWEQKGVGSPQYTLAMSSICIRTISSCCSAHQGGKLISPLCPGALCLPPQSTGHLNWCSAACLWLDT